MTSWKKLLAGSAGLALLGVWGVSLTDCTVCNGPQCFNDDGGGTVDTGTDTGTGDTGVVDSGPKTCNAIKPGGPIFWDDNTGNGPCDKCMTANCCSVAQACIADKDGGADSCYDYVQCIDVCGNDQNCVTACGQTDPNGKTTYESTVLTGCMYVKCGISCMVSDAGM